MCGIVYAAHLECHIERRRRKRDSREAGTPALVSETCHTIILAHSRIPGLECNTPE